MFSETFRAWLNRPFNPEGNIWNWALFVLLVLILIGAWQTVIAKIRPAIAAVA